MMSWFQRIQQPAQRRLCGLIVLLGMCASNVPLPQPSVKPTDKDRSQPFPCQDRPCGCRSADQCWKKCCCFTNTQKLAWAKANRVAAPDYVFMAAADESKSASCRKACCTKELSHGTRVTNAACDGRPQSVDKTLKGPPKTPGTAKYVIGILAEQCKGQSTYWNSLPWAVVSDVVAVTMCHHVADLEVGIAPVPIAITHQPPTPPPRQSDPHAVVIV